MLNEMLSEHFSLREGTYSPTAMNQKIDNSPSPTQLENMKYTASKMEEVRKLLDNKEILVSSWFRSYELNMAIGGAVKSQHSQGQAVDFKCPGYGNIRRICKVLILNKETLGYDQLILEPTWVHISFNSQAKPRGQELTYLGPGQYAKNIE